MDYRPIIESRYNRENWQKLLHDIFGRKVEFWRTPSAVSTHSPFAKQALWLGTITLSDNQTISIYEVELADNVDIERNRRGIRDMLLSQWRNNGNAGAFMFCYRKHESVLRFSYVSESWTFGDDGTYQKESTDTKRFTYLLGEGHRSRTAIQQFEKLRDSSLSLKDLTKAFSVDAVSDMFFKGYKQQYEDIIYYVTGKRMVKVANKWEERQEGTPNAFIMQQFAHAVGGDLQSPTTEKAVRDYVKKLMGRLVFLQFLQKKGWLGVPVDKEWGSGDPEFIQNLFAECKDKDHFIDNELESLFNDLNTERESNLSQLSIFNYQLKIPYLNGGLFERDASDDTEFPLPAKYMQSLLDFFASYNFTIDENDPDDAEVGVDPEMLGRIFENLLEDNKDKGAFYTPKEIVSYMCRESLIAYLQTDIEDETTKESIRQFVTTHDVAALGTNDKFRQQIDEALKDVKICDPAIGSGAFPMGLLKELFQCRTALEGIEQNKAAEIKKHIIQQNIYGVDIERGAVDIARLRFWLSLIVDEETPQALPNLDFKIMQGNSLLEQYKGVDLSNITELKQDKVGTYQTTMFDDMLDVLRLDLRKKLDEYYNCTDHKRKAILKQDIINNVKQQLKEQSINVDFGDLDLSGNNQFMLWHTWFYDVFSQGGFDIVIANPPYISYYSNTGSQLSDELRKIIVKTYVSVKKENDRINSMNLMMEKGLKILSNRGNLVFITNKTFSVLPSYVNIREYILNHFSLDYLVQDISPFDAVVDCVIVGISNQSPNEYSQFKLVNSTLKDYTIEYQSSIVSNRLKEFIVSHYSGILSKMEKQQSKLSDILIINRGVNIGGCFSDFLSNHQLDKRYRRYLSGTANIKKYCYTWNESDGWMKLDQELERSLKLKGKTLALGDPSRYDKNRLFIPESGQTLLAALCKENYYSAYGLMVGTSIDNDDDSLYYACMLLNSKLLTFYAINKEILRKGNKATPHVGVKGLLAIPIPNIKTVPIKKIKEKVCMIMELKEQHSEDTFQIESEIDRLVYQLYGLTEEEIAIIENQ